MNPTWMVRLDAPGDGPRLAVKDCIDVEGLPTTAGCQGIAEQASPAARDAAVVAAGRPGARVDPGTRPTGAGVAGACADARARGGRLRPAPALGVDPATDAAVGAALVALPGLQGTEVTGFDFRAVNEAGNVSIDVEA